MSLTATPGPETAVPTRRPHHGMLSTCTLRHASDDCLVALTRGGSERAFAEIMRRYQRPLQFYCMHLVGVARAEDSVQQAFMQAFVALRDGQRREIALRPWLYRITRNCAIDLLRKQPCDHDELDPEFDGMPQPPGVFEQKEELARIVAAIQALPERQRRALTLRELEGRSYGEISAELGHTDSGVRQLIFRARTALRNLGAVMFPVASIRWRLLGTPATVADPHQVAAAATISSTGGGNALQAAASVMAATVTLLGAGVPDSRDHSHSFTPRAAAQGAIAPARTVSTVLGSGVPAAMALGHGRSGGSHVVALRPEVPAEVGIPAAAPPAVPPSPAVVPPAAPVAEPVVPPQPAEPPATQAPATIATLGGSADAPSTAVTGTGGTSSERPPVGTGGSSAAPARTGGQVAVPSKPAIESPAKPVVPPTKPVKAPASPKPSTPKKPAPKPTLKPVSTSPKTAPTTPGT